MIETAPGATFESFLQGAPAGLVGTLTWRLIDPSDASVEIAASTAGISEVAAGAYRRAATAPTTRDTYLIVWANGAVEVTEELVVTHSAAAAGAPSGADLTTLAAVRAFMQKPAADTDQDDLIQATITRASAAARDYTGRELAPATAGLARKFSYTGGGVLYLGPYDLRAVTLMQIDTDITGQTLTAATDYKLRPLQPRYGVYTEVLLPTQPASDWRPREVTITGDWGFPTVPDVAEEACILTVIDRLKRDVSGYTQAFADDDPAAIPRPISMPVAARKLLDPLRRPMIV